MASDQLLFICCRRTGMNTNALSGGIIFAVVMSVGGVAANRIEVSRNRLWRREHASQGMFWKISNQASFQAYTEIFSSTHQTTSMKRPSLWTHSPTPPEGVKPSLLAYCIRHLSVEPRSPSSVALKFPVVT